MIARFALALAALTTAVEGICCFETASVVVDFNSTVEWRVSEARTVVPFGRNRSIARDRLDVTVAGNERGTLPWASGEVATFQSRSGMATVGTLTPVWLWAAVMTVALGVWRTVSGCSPIRRTVALMTKRSRGSFPRTSLAIAALHSWPDIAAGTTSNPLWLWAGAIAVSFLVKAVVIAATFRISRALWQPLLSLLRVMWSVVLWPLRRSTAMTCTLWQALHRSLGSVWAVVDPWLCGVWDLFRPTVRGYTTMMVIMRYAL